MPRPRMPSAPTAVRSPDGRWKGNATDTSGIPAPGLCASTLAAPGRSATVRRRCGRCPMPSDVRLFDLPGPAPSGGPVAGLREPDLMYALDDDELLEALGVLSQPRPPGGAA